MKYIVGVVLAVITFAVGFSAHGECRRIEYAELKDIDTKNLEDAFCETINTFNINAKAQSEMSKLGAFAKSESYGVVARQCIEELEKIEGVLKRRKVDTQRLAKTRCPVAK